MAKHIFRTRLELAHLSVTCSIRHPSIHQSHFSLFMETLGTCQCLQQRAGAAMLLTCCLTRSQHKVESSCSYRVVFSCLCCQLLSSPRVIMSSVAPVPEGFQHLLSATDDPMGQTWLLSTRLPLTELALHRQALAWKVPLVAKACDA